MNKTMIMDRLILEKILNKDSNELYNLIDVNRQWFENGCLGLIIFIQ